jgi:hypothetical protein
MFSVTFNIGGNCGFVAFDMPSTRKVAGGVRDVAGSGRADNGTGIRRSPLAAAASASRSEGAVPPLRHRSRPPWY